MAQINGIDVLRRAMEKRGWDETRLATESGVHVTLIRRWFGRYGKATAISPENARHVAACLGITPESVIFGKRSAD
jgi:ribosome-binding protein aMBF1 (putative translation factor)